MEAWYRPRSWTLLLLPLAWLFSALVALRRRRWQRGSKRPYRAPVPVIVVGNISVGGTGKTPLVLALAKALLHAGYRPGIVSRGHGGIPPHYPYRVSPESPVQATGDEALLLARESGCPLMIDPDRPAAIRKLLAQTDCNLVISDDGLQHYPMARDVEIAVIDGSRGLGNGLLLPAGPLREGPARLQQVDHVLVNGKAAGPGIPGQAISFQLHPLGLHNLAAPVLKAARAEPGTRVHGVAGIGNPQRFFQTLRALGYEVEAHAFADHHRFKPEDLAFDDGLDIIMTSKDAVKCEAFAKPHYWSLQVEASLPPAFMDALLSRLADLQPGLGPEKAPNS